MNIFSRMGLTQRWIPLDKLAACMARRGLHSSPYALDSRNLKQFHIAYDSLLAKDVFGENHIGKY